MPALERGRLLGDIARALRAQAEEFAALETRDTGKPRHVALAEVETSAQYFEFYSGLTGLPIGETLDIAPDQHVYTLREPYGVIGVITPWNVPLTQAARAAAPALAAGNTLVMKPAEVSSSSTVALGRLASEVGLPPGVLNVVTGSGRVVGTAIIEHPVVGKVAFTGSVPTGRTIGRIAADRIIPLPWSWAASRRTSSSPTPTSRRRSTGPIKGLHHQRRPDLLLRNAAAGAPLDP